MNEGQSDGSNGDQFPQATLGSGSVRPGSNPSGFNPDRSSQTILGNAGSHSPTRHVVTLAFRYGEVSPCLISAQLSKSLCRETGASVILVEFKAQNRDGCLEDGRQPDLSLNGEFHMPSEIPKCDGGYYSLVLGINNDPPTPAGIVSLVRQLSRRFSYVLMASRTDAEAAPWLTECMLRSDLVYLFSDAYGEASEQVDRFIGLLPSRGIGEGSHVRVIGCMPGRNLPEQFNPLLMDSAVPIHLHVRGCAAAGSSGGDGRAADLFAADVRRLAREISGRLLGLALSSGAAKGYSHVGVIQVLEENGIEVDVVAGSSMGAYIGSLWAHGIDGAGLETIAREMEGRWALWSIIDPAFPPRQGFLRGFAVKKRLMRTIGASRFADLPRPLRVVAGNLATLERVVFSRGDVASAVHASCAVPGICVPVTINGETYIDGAVVDPLPVGVLRDVGIGRIIAVNVIPTPERIRSGLHAGREPERHQGFGLRKMFRKLMPANRKLNYFARANILEILLRSIYGAQIRIAETSCRQADVVLRPAISDDRWVDCCKPGKFIALGREAAQRHLEEIKALVATRNDVHEQEPAPATAATLA